MKLDLFEWTEHDVRHIQTWNQKSRQVKCLKWHWCRNLAWQRWHRLADRARFRTSLMQQHTEIIVHGKKFKTPVEAGVATCCFAGQCAGTM